MRTEAEQCAVEVEAFFGLFGAGDAGARISKFIRAQAAEIERLKNEKEQKYDKFYDRLKIEKFVV